MNVSTARHTDRSRDFPNTIDGELQDQQAATDSMDAYHK